MKTYEEAEKYAIALRENCSIMKDPKTETYHVIREFGVEYWKKSFQEVATVTLQALIQKKGTEG